MQRALIGVIVIAILIGGYSFLAGQDTSAATDNGSYLKSFQNLFTGWFASSSDLASGLETPEEGSGSIFGNINTWFRDVTGLGLDKMLLAILKLLLWILKAIFGFVLNFASYTMSSLR